MDEDTKLSRNTLSFVGLANEYCNAIESTGEYEKDEFIAEMLRLLPRLYIVISDVSDGALNIDDENNFTGFGNYVDEDYYESMRRRMESLFGEDDVFLETFEDDMKYSDTPIAASISECLADLFQELFNFVSVVKDSEGSNIDSVLAECKENFEVYWSQTLCNVLKALNTLRYKNE